MKADYERLDKLDPYVRVVVLQLENTMRVFWYNDAVLVTFGVVFEKYDFTVRRLHVVLVVIHPGLSGRIVVDPNHPLVDYCAGWGNTTVVVVVECIVKKEV